MNHEECAMNSKFAEFRKAKFPTQLELAEKMHGQLNDVKAAYLQRRVSLYEASEIRPSDREMKALALAFEVELDEMHGYFRQVAGDVASFFDGLRERPSAIQTLICACFQAPLRAYKDSPTNDAIVKALNAGVFMIFVFPFPLSLSTDPNGRPIAQNLALEAFYRQVWRELVRRYRDLQAQLHHDAHTRLAIYRQRAFERPSTIAVAPMASRYTVDLQKDGSNVEPALFAWTEGTDTQRMFPVGLVSRVETRVLLDAWLDFVGQPLRHWVKEGTLPVNDGECGPMWQRFEPSQIGDIPDIS
jgi:transcriptional regulator with XRE-family HTH domain